MVGLYQKRDPKFCIRAKIYRQKVTEDGSSYYTENAPSNECMCKDDGFKTVYSSVDGHITKMKVGKIETFDLKEDEIMPNDVIEYSGKKYVVTSVSFSDDDNAKLNSLRPYGLTTIEVRQ